VTDSMLGGWTSTGFVQEVDPVSRIPDYDPRSGDHFWVVTVAYRIDVTKADQEGSFFLDQENLVMGPSVGCFHCEKAYSARLVQRRCPGDPT
jgi:hypothetical protein